MRHHGKRRATTTGVARPAAWLACFVFVFALSGLAGSDVTQQGALRVHFAGRIEPRRLPRTGTAPVAVSLEGEISTTDRRAPPELRRITIATNRLGRLEQGGLPRCHYRQIQPASTPEARRACRARWSA